MKKIFFKMMLSLILLISGLAIAGCSQSSSSQSGNESEKSDKNEVKLPDSGPLTINPDISSEQEILSKGPYGEPAISAKDFQLTEEEIEKIKEGKYKAAIAMHYAGNDYSTAQINGLKAAFERMGIEVVAVTDGQFKSEKQVADIETIMAKSPDIIVSLPVDPVSTAPAFKKAADAGIKLVFMDSVPVELEPGKDYVSVIASDNYGNGTAAGDILGEQLGGKGKVGIIYHDVDFFVNNQRREAVETTLKEKYPEIEIVTSSGITTPNDAEKVASAMLTRYNDLDGIFAIWDVPAEGVLAAARTAGKEDLIITTVDLGTNVALEIASGGNVKGLGSQLPFDQGVAEAILAGHSLLGKEVPPFVAVPGLAVTQENVLEAWKMAYRQEAPEVIQEAAKQ
ncbi:substrate-binding domain-containing protein [Priestia flexa]|jgi:ribose transport system substrate-binding protein|uniref:Substrate-binding domain-containing protein n=1 Tax=Priestia flexa TaxID=86664 RepID=A0A8I1MGY6_9BACI|nr:substrate-binding domain-containing protein [Priestia flexa]MBN8252671.1 substrate-binding domain-containing protein [Priestia flexa]MBN8434141.1 substrate-binding domain-containing protein [Priestia flexa]MCA0966674.1 substrate-binding domain-containing protein [Priestia flexa]MCA1201737.1 substrate-binding domain-containing protein [Priestia flexa]MDW8517249.1 substrate-binding domain-containing protein [Priestia flexa]